MALALHTIAREMVIKHTDGYLPMFRRLQPRALLELLRCPSSVLYAYRWI